MYHYHESLAIRETPSILYSLAVMKVCLYCLDEISRVSKDHIFNDFLGGKKTVDSCYACNNDKLGSEIEGRAAADSIHKLLISISSWGLPIKTKEPVRWRSAIQHEGTSFDLILRDGKVEPVLSDPIVKKSPSGKTLAVSHGTRKAAEKALSGMQKKGKALLGEVLKTQLEIKPYQIPMDFRVDDNLLRLAVKMCVALSSKLPHFDLDEPVLGRLVLLGDSHPQLYARGAFEEYIDLDKLRMPLTHVIYVERVQQRLTGVVQFFGVVQVYCNLGKAPTEPLMLH